MTDQKDHKYGTGIRRFERAKFDAAVAVFHRGEFGLERAVEVSEGGMLLRASREYRLKELFEITFFMTGAEFLSSIVEVAYQFESGGETFVGVRFFENGPKMNKLRQEVREYIAERSPKD